MTHHNTAQASRSRRKRKRGQRPDSGSQHAAAAPVAEPVHAPGSGTPAMRQPSVFRFLFRLSADARLLTRDRFLRRLVTGLANHYGASACKVYLKVGATPIASADIDEEIELLPDAQLAVLEEINQRLVRQVMTSNEMASGNDLVHDAPALHEFIEHSPRIQDVFAFPLILGGLAVGAIVLYMPEESKSLGDADFQALMALAEVLLVMKEKGATVVRD